MPPINPVDPLNPPAQTPVESAASMFSAVFHQSSEALSLARLRDGRVVDVNDEWLRLTGYAREEVIGRTGVEIGHWPDDSTRNAAILNPLAETDRLHDVEATLLLKDGSPRLFQLNVSRVVLSGEYHALVRSRDITAERMAEEAMRAGENALLHANERLAEQLELYELTEDLARVGHWTASSDGMTIQWSAGLHHLAGTQPGQDWTSPRARSFIYADDLPAFAQARERMDGQEFQYRWNHPDGSVRWFRTRMRRQIRPDGSPHDFGVVQDITEQKLLSQALQERYDFVEKITSRLPGMVFQFVADESGRGRFTYVSQAVERLSGITAEDALADVRNFFRVVHPDDLPAFKESIRAHTYEGASWVHEFRILLPDGRVSWMMANAVAERDTNGVLVSYGAMNDITARKLAEDENQRLAFYDTLTGLPNRRLLVDRLNQALAMSARTLRHGALLFIDLDNFKDLNDTQGHDVGDQLLQQVAQRLVACIREGDTASRFGGDEFVVMLENLSEDANAAADQAELVGEKILARLAETYQLRSTQHGSTPSIGVTLFCGHALSTDELLKRADVAMYQAKSAGRNTLRFFDPDMQAAVLSRAALEADLRQGLQRGELMLHYQPVVDEHGQTTGYEALVRWQHPTRGMVPPVQFIAMAEQTGLILGLGQWVLEAACHQLVAWSAHPSSQEYAVSVNVSAKQFRQPDFVAQVLSILEQTGADPRRLKLELTESVLITEVEDAIRKMSELRERGVRFALDDFGTGYSSLSYLKRLPLYQIKIDQSFVRDVLTDPNDAAIVRTIIALARSMDLVAVAEGVETEGQYRFLLNNGCRVFQGYLFGRPAPLDAPLNP